MTMAQAQETLDESSPNVPSDEGSVAELRSLLLGPAEKQLAEVHERLFDPQRQVEEVSRVLPDAIAVRTRQDDDLTVALAPSVSAALEHSVRKDPKPLADALFPIMGPAIRKAISAALAGMAQSFNQSMTYSLSAKGLGWRLEALRTGRPFSEVVLLHTLLYRVEQVFLIHRETGLLLRHVSGADIAVQDADMVSGMLTAIQDFVKDSFKTGVADELETLQVGELTVWIAQGPKAILAAVIRGTAPQQVRVLLEETLEKIHLQFGKELRSFSGDASDFALTEPLLQDCLQADYGDQHRTKKDKKITPLTVVVTLLLIAGLVWGFFWIRERRRWNSYLERLRTEPGIVLTDSGKQDGKYYVSGLRDPLAQNPSDLIQGSGLDPNSVTGRWQAFNSLSPDFVLGRAKKILAPPPGAKLKIDDGTLEAEGFASHQWVLETRRVARFLPGVSQFRDDQLMDLERIENPLLMFDLDQVQLRSDQGDKLKRLVDDIEQLCNLAASNKLRLEITGRTDGSGSESLNGALSQGRAETVAAVLKERLSSAKNLTIVALGTSDKLRTELTEDDRATNRSVTMKVVVE